MNRASAFGITFLIALAHQSGCWIAAGVEDRPLHCPSVFSRSVSPACASCLETSCCAELGRCAESLACRQCTVKSSDVPCLHPNEFGELASCVDGHCADACATFVLDGIGEPHHNVLPDTPSEGACIPLGGYFFDRMHCNPVSNEGCAGGDEVCAFEPSVVTWTCRATGHQVAAGETCGLVDGDCAAKHTCINGRCYRGCCVDGDCLPDGKCYTPEGFPSGSCVTPP